MKLLALRNFEIPVSEDMEDALNWFCHKCQVSGSVVVTESEVKAFLCNEEKRPDLADEFTKDLLVPDPVSAQ